MDTSKFINASQIGGIDSYIIDEGQGRGVRALCVNTGGGLRYRVLVDRGLDIDQAFFNQHSLTFLSHKGVTRPTRALDRGLDWLRGFPVGLLTTCGPTNIGGPCVDDGEEIGLHGPHSNSGAEIESVVQPDPRSGKLEMSVTGVVRTGAFYGPCFELRRTIRSRLGENVIEISDEVFNAGNTATPHEWLLHINLGYPLVDEGAELCWDAERVEPLPGDASAARHFAAGNNYRRVPGPLAEHSGPASYVGYVYPRAGKNGKATVGIVNEKLGLGLAIKYDTREFSRCASWQHWGKHEYVTALEPATASVEGRAKDRERGMMHMLGAGERKRYVYAIGVLSEKSELDALAALGRR